MSNDHNIHFRLFTHERLGVLEKLCESGWRTDDHGELVFITASDNGMFDWQTRRLDFDIKSELEKCETLNTTIGVVITFEETQSGGTLVLGPVQDGVVEGFLNIEMNLREHDGIVDVNWYMGRLIPVLRGFTLRSFSYDFVST